VQALLPVSARRLLAKRVFDLAICVLLLPFVAALLIGCAIAIRLDSRGQVLFAQERTGRNGHRFRMYKFRTMVENAEELKEQLRHLSVVPPPDFKIPNDPRITPVGRFLRRSSLDELPQILNVVRGDMSLVGPRPTSFAPSTYRLWHTTRLEVPPGLTGLWQIRGRNTTTFDERLRLDIKYIAEMSILLDLKILAATAKVVVRGSGA
jgi:lipopolysaccharide/colanic/teichoic acid biosynthesis glycosyltransferase